MVEAINEFEECHNSEIGKINRFSLICHLNLNNTIEFASYKIANLVLLKNKKNYTKKLYEIE
jgi:hypothetical protein